MLDNTPPINQIQKIYDNKVDSDVYEQIQDVINMNKNDAKLQKQWALKALILWKKLSVKTSRRLSEYYI